MTLSYLATVKLAPVAGLVESREVFSFRSPLVA
jgi:hypothetical protein